MYRKGVIAIVTNNSKYLLVQLKGEEKGDYNFPGGGLKSNETLIKCLFRELYEELGLNKKDLTLVKKCKTKHTYKYNDKLLKLKQSQGSPFIGQQKHIFILKLNNTSKKLSINTDELSGYKWVVKKDLSKYLLFPNQLKVILTALCEL